MKNFIHKPGFKNIASIVFIGLAIILPRAETVWGQISSGLSLNLYADEQSHPQLQYQLGIDAIEITMVIKNDTPWPVNTDRGFSKVDLHRALILTDPSGTKHAYSQDKAGAFDVLPAISFNQVPATEAEVLPAPWTRSVKLDDLRALFPRLNTVPGWYVIEAQQPFIRFAWTVQAVPVGLLGPQIDPNNWEGTVDSNKLQIYVAPASGAQLQARVLDDSTQPAKPIAQVPVRVFKKDDVPAQNSSPETWDKVAFVLEGVTNPEGWAVWSSESDVQCLPEANYVVMAHYLDKYEEKLIETGTGSGWGSGCQAFISREIVFSEDAPAAIPGDLDGDEDVDNNDYLIFREAYGSCSGGPNFNPNADFDNDGCITMNDYRLFRSYAQQ